MEKKSRKGMWGCLFLIAFLWLGLIATGIGFYFLFNSGHSAKNISFGEKPVAVVLIQGPIYESLPTLKELQNLKNDSTVKAIVVRVDSPGGAVGPSQEIFRELTKIKKTKKVVVSMGTVAASGGYYISSAADQIVASPGTITGSIGVIMELVGLQKLAEKIYLDPRTIKSGKFKDAGNPFKELTEVDKAYLQNISDDMYKQFVTDVAQNRNIPVDKMFQLAEGKVYTGKQAKDVGLVDQLGNIYDAIDVAKELAGLPAKAGVSWPREKSAFEKFLEGEAKTNLIEKWLGLQQNHLPSYLFKQKFVAQPY